VSRVETNRLRGRHGVLAAVCALSALVEVGCSSPCCTFDETPIALLQTGGDPKTAGALLAKGAADGKALSLVFDTGSPLTYFNGAASDSPALMRRSFSLVDGKAPDGALMPERAILNGIGVLSVPLRPLSDGRQPDVVLGADVLRGYSIELSFAQATGVTVTFWGRQGASDDALASAGFAVLHATLFGGTEISARGEKDFLHMTGPLYVSPSRVVLRTCANPPPFSPKGEAPPACCASTQPNPSVGADLSLVLATGLGPVVLSESGWARTQAAYARDKAAGTQPGELSEPTAGPDLTIATFADPIPARWTTLPRLALVDLQASASSDPGPCVELSRARRIEWAEAARAAGTAACFATCDADPQDRNRSATTAAYTELSHDVPVAVISDVSDLLQGVRAEIRPEGPEVDGFIGAGVLADLYLELDYRSTPARAIFKCETTDRSSCFSAPRCSGVRDDSAWRGCFGLTAPAESPPLACFAPRC